MTTEDTTSGGTPIKYKRKWRNYLLDVGLQIRYTAFIVAIAIFLTAVLGYKIYEATRDTSRVISITGLSGLVDPVMMQELEAQFRANDRVVLFGIVGFGVLLVFSIFGAGVWITHKVAGPLYSIAQICKRVRDNRLAPSLRQLRKGDELQDFYGSFREMYEALRVRVANDVQVLGNTIAALEALSPKPPQVQELLAELRDLRKQKEQSLDQQAGS